jgi:translocator protein
MSKSRSRSLIVLAAFGAATAGVAWYSYNSRERDRWSREFDGQGFQNRDFPLVWITLYALIAWSGWRVWSAAPSRYRSAALRLWISQLAANAKWSKLLFGRPRIVGFLADSIALEATIWSYINSAWKVDRAAAGAFVPYAAWVAFTTALNAEIERQRLLRR